MSRPPRAARLAAIALLCALGALLVWGLNRPPKQPRTLRLQKMAEDLESIAVNEAQRADARLVRQLLDEHLGERSFSFATVVLAAADRKVTPLDRRKPSHARVVSAIEAALRQSVDELNRPGSPVRGLRRINEASRFFEDSLREKLDAHDGLSCSSPVTRQGRHQRSGYPDLRIVDAASGDVFYLDPKLVGQDSWDSGLRSFYFEPTTDTLKINDHAVHLLAGISHDGKDGAWTFGEWKLVDLSTLEVRLKAEFQASNKDLYR